jgi:AraC-like DNA-binding protein
MTMSRITCLHYGSKSTISQIVSGRWCCHGLEDPSGFVQSRRYHAARRDLLAADGKTATVQAIAQCNGFYQMGRFALRYRERFGESPSETLMKPPTDGQCGLPWWEASDRSLRVSRSLGSG